MTKGMIRIRPKEKDKLHEVVAIANNDKGCQINIQSIDEAGTVELEYSNPNDLFILGRIFEPYRICRNSGSISIEADNSFINQI